MPLPVLGEIGYLLESRVGPQAEVTFLKSFGSDGFQIAELEEQDIRRMAELVETYIDLPLGMVDAAVIAIAERLRLTEIATLDHRHFAVVQQKHTPAFILLPSQMSSDRKSVRSSAHRPPIARAHPLSFNTRHLVILASAGPEANLIGSPFGSPQDFVSLANGWWRYRSLPAVLAGEL